MGIDVLQLLLTVESEKLLTMLLHLVGHISLAHVRELMREYRGNVLCLQSILIVLTSCITNATAIATSMSPIERTTRPLLVWLIMPV